MSSSSCKRRAFIASGEQLLLSLLSSLSPSVVVLSWCHNSGRLDSVLANSCVKSGSDITTSLAELGEQQNVSLHLLTSSSQTVAESAIDNYMHAGVNFQVPAIPVV